jgi:hypothetical protein
VPPDEQRDITAKEVELTGAKSQLGIFLYCAFSFPLFLFALFAIRDITAILVFGLFAAFGVAGIVQMCVIAAGQSKFGDLRLRLGDPLPSLGGRLHATLQLPPQSTAAAFTLHANFICNTVTYGEHRSRTETALQGVRVAIPVAQSASGATVTIACDIPGDLPATNDPGAAGAVENTKYAAWELKVRAEFEGVDLERSYDIEVAPMLPGTVWPKPETLQAAAPIAARPAVVIPEAALPEVANPKTVPAAQEDETSLWVLVGVNLVPLAGVMFWGWRVHEIVFLYWIENLVIGAANLLRIRVAVPDSMLDLAKRGIDMSAWELGLAKAMLGAFFFAHYGAFCYGHGELLASMFPYEEGGGQGNSLGSVFGRMLFDSNALVAITAIVVSHAYSYFHNYIGKGEYLRANMGDLMTRPYKRIGVTHIFVIVGGFALVMIDSPVAAMLVFVTLKIWFDAGAHRKERSGLSTGRSRA